MHNRISPINKHSLVCGAACAASYIFTILAYDSPIEFLHQLKKSEMLPPIWLFILISVSVCFLAGIAAGSVIRATVQKLNIGDYERSAYRGGLFFLSGFYLFLTWYPIIFSGGHLFISALIIALCVASAVACVLCWFNCHPAFASILMMLFSCWVIYIFIANAIIFFSN